MLMYYSTLGLLTDIDTLQGKPKNRKNKSKRQRHAIEPMEPRVLLTVFGPWLATPDWNQLGFIPGSTITYNQYTPMDPATDVRSVTGCVATAVSQLEYYWHTPLSMFFSSAANHYVSNFGTTSAVDIDGDFLLRDFPSFASLSSALTNIKYNNSANEKALLSFANGILFHADYSSSGTTAVLSLSTLQSLGFTTAQMSANWASVESTVIANIEAGRPILLSVTGNQAGTGHVLLVDGYNDATQTFHLDMGWGGSFDGWNSLDNLTGAPFTAINGVIYNIAATTNPIPNNVSASDGTFTDKVQITWHPVAQATGYDIYRSQTNDPASAVKLNSTPITTTLFDDTTAGPGPTYIYWVVAKSTSGDSGFSTPDTGFREAVAIPSVPTNVSATDGTYTDKVRITWTASTNAAFYDVYRSTVNNPGVANKLNTTGVTGTLFDDTTATMGTSYFYWVNATNTLGTSDFSAPDIGYRQTVAIPQPPTNVSASDGTFTDRVEITWTASLNAASYDIFRFTTNNPGISSMIGHDVTNPVFEDTTGTVGTTYFYWVKAKNSAGTSDYSASDTGYRVAPSAPQPPTNVSASDGTFTDHVHISWTASTGATSYDVYRFTSNNNGSATAIATGLTTTSYDDATALSGTTYYYWVKAKNSIGASDFSIPDTGYVKQTTSIPNPPTGVAASDGTFTDHVHISWTASSGATAYDIYRYTSNGSGLSLKINSADITTTSYDDTTALVNKTYWYWIKAKNSAGTSGFSSGDSGYMAPVTIPSPPSGVSASDGTFPDRVRITWNASAGASSYSVYRYTSNSSGLATLLASGVTATSYDDTTAALSKTYWYWIKATNAAGTSGFSSGNSGYTAPVTIPAAPTGVAASNGTLLNKVRITWNASAGATAYDVYRYTSNSSGLSTKINTTNITTTVFEDTTASTGVTYWYWVKARNSAGTSGFSAGVIGTPAVNILPSTIGVYRSSTAMYYLRNTNTPGSANIVINYGAAGDVPVVGDWNGDGITTIGIYRPSNSTFYLRNSNTAGFADLVINYGAASLDTPVVGDWNGDGITTVGVYRSSTATFYLRNSNTAGFADLVINYGAAGDQPVAGDWNGDGTSTVGIYRPSNSTFYLKNTNAAGIADLVINYGASSQDTPVVGDWNGDGTVTIGVYRSSAATFFLKNSNSGGIADLVLNYGANGDTPIAGVWAS